MNRLKRFYKRLIVKFIIKHLKKHYPQYIHSGYGHVTNTFTWTVALEKELKIVKK